MSALLAVLALLVPAPGPGHALTDPPEADAIHFTLRGRWGSPLGLKVRIDAEGCPVDVEAYREAVSTALELWESTGVVSFELLADDESSVPDITVGWRARRSPHDPPFLHGRIARTGRVERGTFIHFNRDRRWSYDGGDAPGMVQTAIHEVGHVLGLDHSANPGSSLFSRYDRANRELSESDRAGLHTLYGGGTDGEGDLRIVRFDGDGKQTVLSPILRRVAPPKTRDFAVLDLDGDGRDEIFTWPLKRDFERGFLIFRLNLRHQVESTMGPFPLVVEPGLAVHFAKTRDGRAVILHHDPTGRYAVARFRPAKVLPLEPWPSGTPLALSNGLRDSDGDGTLDTVEIAPEPSPKEGHRLEDRCDLDGDGSPEALVSRPRRDRRLFLWLRGDETIAKFTARRVERVNSGGAAEHEWVILP